MTVTTNQLVLGRTIQWMESFIDGYTVAEKGILEKYRVSIDPSWKVAKNPDLYQYSYADFKDLVAKGSSVPYAKGYATALWVWRNKRGRRHGRR